MSLVPSAELHRCDEKKKDIFQKVSPCPWKHVKSFSLYEKKDFSRATRAIKNIICNLLKVPKEWVTYYL